MPDTTPIPFIVIVQTPVYGTLTWGPFATRAKATKFLKTGLLVVDDSPHTPEERQEWIDAVNEWFELNGGE